MTEKEFQQAKERYESQKARFEKVQPGDTVYTTSAQGIDIDFFKCTVIEVNVPELIVHVIDHSLNNKRSDLYSFYTEEEFQNYCKSWSR